MIVHFLEPPSHLRTGGLDVAIRSLERFLLSVGVSVRINPGIERLDASDAPDVVHFHGLWRPDFLRFSAHCHRRGVPYVVSPHGMLEPWAWRHKLWKKWPWFHLFERRHLTRASALLTTSEAEARNLAKFLPSARIRAVPLGLTSDKRADYAAARRTLGWGKSEVVLLFLSRIHPKKGLHTLLRAISGLDPKILPDVRLVVVGGGERRYVASLKRLAEKGSMSLPRVEWKGEIWGDEKWTYFQGADLFCLPSLTENFGLAVLESLQVGTRVMTTDRTPWGVVESWGAGTIVAPEEESIRSALAEFFASPADSDARRVALSSEIHERFSWETIGKEYVQFYDDVIKTAREQRTA